MEFNVADNQCSACTGLVSSPKSPWVLSRQTAACTTWPWCWRMLERACAAAAPAKLAAVSDDARERAVCCGRCGEEAPVIQLSAHHNGAPLAASAAGPAADTLAFATRITGEAGEALLSAAESGDESTSGALSAMPVV